MDWNQRGQVFMSDSVHPNELGHAIYTQAIVTYLNSQIGAPPSPPPSLPAPLVSAEFATRVFHGLRESVRQTSPDNVRSLLIAALRYLACLLVAVLPCTPGVRPQPPIGS
jgi:hypothetical protein